MLTPAAAVATLILYDNTAASGQVLARLQAPANGESVWLPGPIAFQVGCFADIGGAGAGAVVYI